MEALELAAIRRVREGDADAFEALVATHSRAVFRICHRIVGNPAVAEDAVQEAFLRAFRFLAKFDDRAEFSTWLHRIAVNAAIDELRKRRRDRWVGLDEGSGRGLEATVPSHEPAPDRLAISSELGRAAAAALSELTPVERAAFVLRHYEGRSIAEISAALGKRDNATKQSIFRAVRKLRAVLTPLLETPHEALP